MTPIRIQKTPVLPKTFFRKYTSVGVLVDPNTRKHCYEKIRNQLPRHHVFEVPEGEQHKNLETCQRLWQDLTDAHFDRHSLLLVLGGGVPGDLGGFCASTFKRGIDFVLVPTTLLAMVDASIGGKTGVDVGPIKNHVGTFAMPAATWIATDFLHTLPPSELRSGFAEVIKHCLLGDHRMWDAIRKKSLDNQDWPRLIRHSTKFKGGVVKKDPREAGLRKILNYGHTIGHALEGNSLRSGNRLLHGEAVAAGMVVEAFLSHQRKMLTLDDTRSIAGYVISIFGKVEIQDPGQLISLMRQDKKNKGNEICVALPGPVGKARWDIEVSEKDIRKALASYRDYQT
ncbi:MAG: 3-dehydroquinate synthase [Cytophagales bacterium]|nr:3-dehydroquinate synthase [Cytophagales bacterium]